MNEPSEEVKEAAMAFAFLFNMGWCVPEFETETLQKGLILYCENKELLENANLFSVHPDYAKDQIKDGEITIGQVLKILNSPAVPEAVKEKIQYALDTEEEEPTSPLPKRSIGSIYLGKSASHSYTKIGFSKRPELRESTLQAEDPSFEIVYRSTPCFTRKDEEFIHNKFTGKRVRGEWFALEEKEINKIKNYLERKAKK